MSNLNQRFQPRDGDIAAKVIDGEAIIINLANGTYYSLDNAGGVIWEMIQERRTQQDMATTLAKRYGLAIDQAVSDMERLVAELFREELIESSADELGSSLAETARGDSPEMPYEAPSLKIYRDMGDLLALDPPTPGLDAPWNEADPTAAHGAAKNAD